jgi:amino acid permease
LADPSSRKEASDISETPSPEHLHQHRLVRTLGLVDVVMIGIAGMIGLAGSAVVIAFVINGIITLFTAMGYAELGSAKRRLEMVTCGLEQDCRDLTRS